MNRCTGYTCGDLFLQQTLLTESKKEAARFVQTTAEIQNESFSLNFEEEQEDEDSELEDEASCVYWEEATPILKQVAAVAYRTAKSELNVDTERRLRKFCRT